MSITKATAVILKEADADSVQPIKLFMLTYLGFAKRLNYSIQRQALNTGFLICTYSPKRKYREKRGIAFCVFIERNVKIGKNAIIALTTVRWRRRRK